MKPHMLAAGAGVFVSALSFAEPYPEIVAPPVSVTATRFAAEAEQQPASITVISGEQLRRSPEISLPSWLSRQVGVGALDNTGSPDPQIDLRGFGITGSQNTLVLVDGQRLTENELTAPRLSSIPLQAIDRIEIVRGTGSVLYGSGATGGVINIITRPPSAGESQANVAAGAGNYDTREARASAAIAGEHAGVAIYGRHSASENYRDNNRFEQNNLVADLNWRADATALALSAGGDVQLLRLPGNRTAQELISDRRGTRTPDDYSNISGGFARLTLSQAIGRQEFALDLGYRRKTNDFNAVIFGVPLRGTTDVERWSATPRARLEFDAIGVDHEMVVGADLESWDYRSVRTNPADVTAQQDVSALFVQDTVALSAGTRLVVGGRRQRINYSARDTASIAGALDADQTRSVGAYEFGLRQAIGRFSSVYARYGQSFRVATLDEIYTPSIGAFLFPGSLALLEPQTSHDAEIGVEYRPGDVLLRISAFNYRISNEIHFDPTTGANVNLPPTRRQGVELEARRRFAALEVFGTYSYTDARFRSGSLGGVSVEGNRMPLVPYHRAGGGVVYYPDERTRLGAHVTFVGTQRYDNDELNSFSREMPAYHVVDLSASRTIGRWRLSALVNNALNAHYYSYALAFAPSSLFAYPAAERSFFVSADYRFGK